MEKFINFFSDIVAILKQLFDREGIKAQLTIIPILGFIQVALKNENNLLSNIFSFLFMYICVIIITIILVQFGKKSDFK